MFKEKGRFISLVIKPGEHETLQSSEVASVLISNVCIPDVSAGKAPSRLFATVSGGPTRALLATLVPETHETEMLNFKVPLEQSVKMEVTGAHPIHVIGYMNILDDDLDVILEEEDEEEEEKE